MPLTHVILVANDAEVPCLDGKTYAVYQECRIYCTDEAIAVQAKQGQNSLDVQTLDMRSHMKAGMTLATVAGGILAVYQRVQDPTGSTLLTEAEFAVENLGSAAWKIGTTWFQ